MFEDTDAIKRIREKSHFEAVFEDREEEFNERLADVFFHKMINQLDWKKQKNCLMFQIYKKNK